MKILQNELGLDEMKNSGFPKKEMKSKVLSSAKAKTVQKWDSSELKTVQKSRSPLPLHRYRKPFQVTV